MAKRFGQPIVAEKQGCILGECDFRSENKTEMQISFVSEAATALFEELATFTWKKIASAHQAEMAYSEETITEQHMLIIQQGIRSHTLPGIFTLVPSKPEEGKVGFDWEWWIGSDADGWFRYVVQAKLLNLKSQTYKDLRHKVKQINNFQIEVLKSFAGENNAIPLYCFYNHVSQLEADKAWHCIFPHERDLTQLECTLVPLNVVKPIHDKRVGKKFSLLHESREALPWRCLFHAHIRPQCRFRTLQSGKVDILPPFIPDNWEEKVYKQLPEFLQRLRSKDPIIIDEQIYQDFYANTFGAYPQRIMLVETQNIEIRDGRESDIEIGRL